MTFDPSPSQPSLRPPYPYIRCPFLLPPFLEFSLEFLLLPGAIFLILALISMYLSFFLRIFPRISPSSRWPYSSSWPSYQCILVVLNPFPPVLHSSLTLSLTHGFVGPVTLRMQRPLVPNSRLSPPCQSLIGNPYFKNPLN